ncbi:MAG TPA: nicotinamide-nucleotide amidohydrolase family protein [Chloroflexia bacterium]|nr:nicotinamide-nucleotide amidohydrolase family protein [Chloroflexia bacterium]
MSDALTETVAACARLLEARGWRLAVAESCTGGLVGHLLTEQPGSSAWFLGGVIAYDDVVKTGLLGVAPSLIREHGAVSGPCAAALADAVAALLGTEASVTVTGIAGPGGGTPAKPVGTVYIAVHLAGRTTVAHHVWAGTRSANKAASARAALDHLREQLERG